MRFVRDAFRIRGRCGRFVSRALLLMLRVPRKVAEVARIQPFPQAASRLNSYEFSYQTAKAQHQSALLALGLSFPLVTLALAALSSTCQAAEPGAYAETLAASILAELPILAALGWGSLPAVALLVLLLLAPLKALAVDYFVRTDGNNNNTGTGPSASEAWQSVAAAADSKSLGPGDRVFVRTGTYAADVVEPNRDGTAEAPIRFIADTDGSIFGGSGGPVILNSTKDYVIRVEKQDYISFTGFEMANANKQAVKLKNTTGVVIENCTISGGSVGVLVEHGDTMATVKNCLIHSNGNLGIEVKSGMANFWNCTIVNNSGHGVEISGGTTTLTNSVIVNNSGAGLRRSSGTLTNSYNLLFNNGGGNYSGVVAGMGEITADPLFVGSGDYRLRNNSPAIDAGTEASGTVDSDLDWRLRPIGSGWDMGCYEAAPAGNLLLVVTDPTGPTSQESDRRMLIQSFGYHTNLIDDDASQSEFDTALANNRVAYVSQAINPLSLSNKLAGVGIGVVNEHADLADEFGLASTTSQSSQMALEVVNDTHYVTAPFALGPYNIYASPQTSVSLSGTVSSELQVPAQWGSARALSLLEAGGKRHDEAISAGRRVQLPWGGSLFDINDLSADGQTLMKRAIRWAGGIVGHWRLDETTGTIAADSSGHNNHGTLVGVTFDSGSVSPGKLDNALAFDGTDDYVSIGSNPLFDLEDEITVACWIQVHSFDTEWQAIVTKGDTAWRLQRESNTDSLAFAGTGLTGDWRAAGSVNVNDGKWHHVAGVYDGTTLQLYVDGSLDVSVAATGTIDVNGHPVYIGENFESPGRHFHGLIDDVRLYNYALDPSEMASLRRLGQPAARGVRILKWIEVK